MHRQNNPSNVFSPEEVGQLKEAFARSWQALCAAYEDQDSLRAREVRDMLARLILNFAQQGVKDPIELSDRALASLRSVCATPDSGGANRPLACAMSERPEVSRAIGRPSLRVSGRQEGAGGVGLGRP